MVKSKEEKRTSLVVIIALITMILEISIGVYSQSMALLAEGIHQGGHVLVIGLSWVAYILVRRLEARDDQKYNRDRVLTLSAYTSGFLLLLMAVVIIVEAIERLLSPEVHILYSEALTIAVIGLVVNTICAFILHSHSEEEDLNHHAAYLHVLADAVTGICAVVGLICAKIWIITWIDSVIALLSAFVIIKWASGLVHTTAKKILLRDE